MPKTKDKTCEWANELVMLRNDKTAPNVCRRDPVGMLHAFNVASARSTVKRSYSATVIAKVGKVTRVTFYFSL